MSIIRISALLSLITFSTSCSEGPTKRIGSDLASQISRENRIDSSAGSTDSVTAGAGTTQNCRNSLNLGERLRSQSKLCSPNGRFELVMQGDGNLVAVKDGTVAYWSTQTFGAGVEAVFQTDGNFVIIGSQPLWNSETAGKPSNSVVIQNDGNLVIYGTTPGEVIWSPSIQQSQNDESIDTLQWVAPCLEVGCNVSHKGLLILQGNKEDRINMNWVVTKKDQNSGRGYIVKGTDARCWERIDWDSDRISVTHDNCWWADGYQYSRLVDGTWLMRWWKPGQSVTVDHTVFGGTWDTCSDTPVGAHLRRTMTFVMRKTDYDWGSAGKLDTILIRQSYPHDPKVREHYYYAKGHGLIAWNFENDHNPEENRSDTFIEPSDLHVSPQGTPCVTVESTPSGIVTNVARAEVNVPATTQTTAPANIQTTAPATTQTTVPATTQTTVPATTQTTTQATTPTTAQPAASAPTPACTGLISRGFSFTKDTPIYSCNRRFSLVFQSDGNLVLYRIGGQNALWNTQSGGSDASTAVFQTDGNLVVSKGSTVLWNSHTGGQPENTLVLQDDGNLVIRKNSIVLWNSGTGGN